VDSDTPQIFLYRIFRKFSGPLNLTEIVKYHRRESFFKYTVHSETARTLLVFRASFRRVMKFSGIHKSDLGVRF